jgi:hypothetical protein
LRWPWCRKLDAGDKAMDSEFGDSLKAGAQVFPLLKNVKKHLKRVKKVRRAHLRCFTANARHAPSHACTRL